MKFRIREQILYYNPYTYPEIWLSATYHTLFKGNVTIIGVIKIFDAKIEGVEIKYNKNPFKLNQNIAKIIKEISC